MSCPGTPAHARFPSIVFVIVAALPLAAQVPAAQNVAAPAPQESREAVAEVDGVAITNEQIEKVLGSNLRKLQEQIYDMKRQALDAIIAERLLAKEAARRNTTPATLVTEEVMSKGGAPVTEEDVNRYYLANKAQLQGKGDEATVRSQIRSMLQARKIQAARDALVETLKSKATIAIHLAAPPVDRVEINLAGAPFRGSADALVTIVEFSDFHCPFCRQIEDDKTLTEILARYGNRVRLVWFDYPIDELHPRARAAHEAARCAREQGKFWQYHDALYVGPPKSGEDLKAVAKEVGLDLPGFDACVASGRPKAAVQNDVDEGRRLTVGGTPTFFINGRPFVGAQPLDAFVRIVNDELERAGAAGSTSR